MGLRQELVDLVYQVHKGGGGPFGHPHGYHAQFNEPNLHKVITQSLGFEASGNPYGGFRYAVGRDIQKAEWNRVFDLICRLWDEIPLDLKKDYVIGVNRILAAYRIAWDLGPDGCLHRVTPPVVQAQIEATFRELNDPRFSAAMPSFRDAIGAYDDRPQRGRDTCKNIMDALESVAKEKYGMPTATFGNVLAELRKAHCISLESVFCSSKAL